MNRLSLAAMVVAACALTAPALAQGTSVNTNTGGNAGVSTSVGGTNVGASTNVGANAGVSTGNGGTSVDVGANAGVSASASGEAGSGNTGGSAGGTAGGSAGGTAGGTAGSSSSAQGSGTGSAGGTAGASTSAEAGGTSGTSSSGASGASASSAANDKNCSNLDTSTLVTTNMDPASLAAVTDVTVFSTTDCSGLADAVSVDSGVQAAIVGNAVVAKAIADAGYQGRQIVGYTLDGTSLTVYVKP